MSTAADEFARAVRQLRPSSPTVATHTVAVRLAPAVANAVAELLDTAASMAREYPELAEDHDRNTCDDYACDLMGAAVTLARTINGGQP